MVDPLTQVETGSVDVIWLGGEIGYTPLLQEVPRWRKKFPVVAWPENPVRADESIESAGLESRATGKAGLVCGGFHDVWAWPESTVCVEMLLGTPEVITAGGEWMKREAKVESERLERSSDSHWQSGAAAFSLSTFNLHLFPLPIPLEAPERTVPLTRDYGIGMFRITLALRILAAIRPSFPAAFSRVLTQIKFGVSGIMAEKSWGWTKIFLPKFPKADISDGVTKSPQYDERESYIS